MELYDRTCAKQPIIETNTQVLETRSQTLKTSIQLSSLKAALAISIQTLRTNTQTQRRRIKHSKQKAFPNFLSKIYHKFTFFIYKNILII